MGLNVYITRFEVEAGDTLDAEDTVRYFVEIEYNNRSLESELGFRYVSRWESELIR